MLYCDDPKEFEAQLRESSKTLSEAGIALSLLYGLNIREYRPDRACVEVTWERLRDDGRQHSLTLVNYFLSREAGEWKIAMIDQVRSLGMIEGGS